MFRSEMFCFSIFKILLSLFLCSSFQCCSVSFLLPSNKASSASRSLVSSLNRIFCNNVTYLRAFTLASSYAIECLARKVEIYLFSVSLTVPFCRSFSISTFFKRLGFSVSNRAFACIIGFCGCCRQIQHTIQCGGRCNGKCAIYI